MIGIIIILIVSWALLYLLQKKNLCVLGIFPIKKRVLQGILGFFFALLLNGLMVFIYSEIAQQTWSAQPSILISEIAVSFWFHLKSALYEELLFRGAILYILLARLKATYALLISSAAFGVYHWFSYGMLGGSIIPLVYIFVITGFMGYAWGYSYVKTKSIALALGMHLGWNYLTTLCLDGNPYGELVFASTGGSVLSNTMGTIISILKGIVPPIIVLVFVKYYTRNKKPKPVSTDFG
ncbi:CPBP family intramembrane glutamic endopeptidase [Rasiella sp. SM2506]|uniref:CPBP family intramembrane glutamic endopeptidase n=1 Tax=Rasiella sp. SM2506 TaxID=3423914 RepID=UPI003D7AD62B